ncbi:MAG: pseudouridine synthase [Bacteroidota bacterium]
MSHHYFLIYKPFNVLSQFTKEVEEHRTLAELGDFPADVYPVGRLDKDSEGLLLLTNDKPLNHRLLNPTFKHKRTYYAQVEGEPTPKALRRLNQGVDIRVNKKPYTTLPAQVRLLTQPPDLPEREPPIRFRKNKPTAWLELRLHEGKNRQVRRMCAAVGYPVLRLVRVAIEEVRMEEMIVGKVLELSGVELYEKLGISSVE